MTLQAHTNSIRSLALLSNGDLASGSGDNSIIIWNPNNGIKLMTLQVHTLSVISLALLSNGDLASGSYDDSIIIWG